MTYSIFSDHAPTGESATRVVSSNSYSTKGRSIGYPNNFDLYTRYIADEDGSQTIVESRAVTDLIGSRLYLYHRPLVNSDGSVSTITVSDGTIDTSYTSASQGYIVFSSLPTAAFTVSYSASPDCDTTWALNNIQDSIMEIEAVLGCDGDTTYPGIKNLRIGIFDNPTGFTASGVLNNGISLPHLNQSIRISSTDESALAALIGSGYTIQIGRQTDNLIFDTTGFTIRQGDGSLQTSMVFGSKTGDTINWKGSASGAGPLTLGGAEWSGYSGVTFAGDLTPDFYTGSMLRVHGNVSVMGGLNTIGNITIVNTTGETSTVLGDWTVNDELFVNGISHLNGVTETNRLNVNQNLYIYKDLVAGNDGGAGGQGQSLVDGLDCSEVAHTYRYAFKVTHPNSVIKAPMNTGAVSPKNTMIRPWMSIGGANMVGDVFAITGQLNAAASASGAHPHILQLLMTEELVVDKYADGVGSTSGVWSPGMMDPGSMWLKMLDGPAQYFSSSIYGYTVEETGASTITRLNVFLPEAIANPPQTNNIYVMYNPGSVAYSTITANGGASPTFSINASTTDPLVVSFEDSVRIMSSNSSTYSLSSALNDSISGLAGTTVTGIAYIFADSNNIDVESAPIFKARATPYKMNGQTPIGEVVASYSGSTWTVLENISYRPNGKYDSAWIPIYDVGGGVTSGRCVPGITGGYTQSVKLYFNHYLGSDVDIGNISANLYLGGANTSSISWNKTHTPLYSFFGQDNRAEHSLNGSLIHVPLGASRTTTSYTGRDASIFYLDSAVIGIDISPGLLQGFPYSGSTTGIAPDYLRLIINKNN